VGCVEFLAMIGVGVMLWFPGEVVLRWQMRGVLGFDGTGGANGLRSVERGAYIVEGSAWGQTV